MMILHTESSMNFGGQELRICIEMEGLKKYGIDSILACRAGSKIASLANERGLRYYEVPFRASFDPYSIRRVFSIIRKYRVDIVNSHNSKDAWNSAIVCKIIGIPFVRSRHIGLQIRSHILGRMIYTTLPDRVLVTGKYIEDMLIKHGVKPPKIARIPTGININRFSGPKNSLLKKQLGLNDDVFLVGFVSVVRSDKGPHYFVTSVPYVLKHSQDVRFVIVGDGNFLQKVKLLVDELDLREFLFFTGHRDDIDIVLKGIDLFVLPAVKPEGIPQAILQAFASGLPVVATDIGGVNEVALHEETALLVKPRDPEGLANAIIYLIEHRDVASRLAEAGRKLAGSYTLEDMLLKMKYFYEEIKK
jgi:glycosyltransferase involved in cell wall biosynthesis